MSQVYSTEPQTAGRVILDTTHGPLEIQLWCRECPATTKYFLQLCLDGYYDNVLFHRMVPNFLVQTGALRYNPTASKQAAVTSLDPKDFTEYRRGASANEALERRQYELNSRIRFNHRGQVAMALPVDSDNLGEEEMAMMQPQFFITLDETAELDGKHVCFGTVTGPTIFNALRIGNTDVDEHTKQPSILEEAPRIERVKILENPIHPDIVPLPGSIPWRDLVPSSARGSDVKKTKKNRKGIKNLNVLSFGDEMEEEGTRGGGGIKSSHDVVQSKRLAKNVDKKLEMIASRRDEPIQKKPKLSAGASPGASGGNNAALGKPLETAEEASPQPPPVVYKAPNEREKGRPKAEEHTEPVTKKSDSTQEKKEPKMSLVEARRAKYSKQRSKDKKQRERETIAKFIVFQNKISAKNAIKDGVHSKEDDVASMMLSRTEKNKDNDGNANDAIKQEVASYHGQVMENKEEAEDDWMKTRFKCRKHQDLDAKLGGDGRDAMEDYEVVDEKHRSKHGGGINRHTHRKRGNHGKSHRKLN